MGQEEPSKVPDLTELRGRWAIGSVRSADYVAWAVAELVGGTESTAVAILAGLDLDSSADTRDVERQFERCLAERGIPWPPDRDVALLEYAKHLCEQIVARRIDPLETIGRLSTIYRVSGYRSVFGPWDILEDDLAFVEAGESPYYHREDALRDPAAYVREAAAAFLWLAERHPGPEFFDRVCCPQCGHTGPPDWNAPDTRPWMPRWLIRWRERRAASRRARCASCSNPDIRWLGGFDGILCHRKHSG